MTPACSVWRRTNGRRRATATTATYGKLRVEVYPTQAQAGNAAAEVAGDRLRRQLIKQPRVRIIFAAAASQIDFLAGLAREPGVHWTRVEAFQMDGRSQANDASSSAGSQGQTDRAEVDGCGADMGIHGRPTQNPRGGRSLRSFGDYERFQSIMTPM